MPSQRSTPGSSTQRRSPHDARARSARWRSRSGLIRASARRHRRRRCAASSTSKCALERRHHRRAHLRRRGLELARHHTGPVGVEPARAHRRVQPTQPGLGPRCPRARRPPAAPPQPPGARRAPRTPPAPPTRSPARPTPRAPTRGGTSTSVPSSRYSRLDRRQPRDRGILHRRRHVDHPLQRPHRARPLIPRPAPPPTAPAPQSTPPPQHRRPPPPASGPTATTSHPQPLICYLEH